MKYIEIIGGGFTNKGAELMLHAVLEKINQNLPDAKVVIAPGGKDTYKKRALLGLYQKISFSLFNIPIGLYIGKFIPRKFRLFFGLVTHNEIDLVFDMSGFKYSDQWGNGPTVEMALLSRKWKRNGTSIYLLPQAFGPFKTQKIQTAFKSLSKNVEMIFPRDDVSFNYVTNLLGKQDRIIQSPDFTCLVKGVNKPIHKELTNRYCIIPNYRMIDKSAKEQAENYLQFIEACISSFIEKNLDPFILIHEGNDDLKLAQLINKRSRKNISIIQEEDPLVIKGIIGNCSGVISSRFHGCVSALVQGIPALSTGWTHKYQLLFKEFDYPEGCIDINASPKVIYDHIASFTDPAQSEKIKKKLRKKADDYKTKTDLMWGMLFTEIKKKYRNNHE